MTCRFKKADEEQRIAVWSGIVNELIAEAKLSKTIVAREAQIDYPGFNRFLNGSGRITLPALERVLAFLQYDLEAVSRAPVEPNIRRRTRPVATGCTQSAEAG